MLNGYLLVVMILLLTLIYCSRRHKSRLPLPPSPPSDPLIGHLRVLPSSNEHRAYRDLGAELKSDLISLTVLGQVIVVLNSAEAAADLLVKRSAIYSDRAQFPMLNDDRLLGWGKVTSFLPYGERWRSQRKMTQSALHPRASADLWSTIVTHTRLSLQTLLHFPNDFDAELHWMAGSIILSSVYGYEATSRDDPLVEVTERAINRLGDAALAGNFYVNTIPWLKYVPDWFPGAGWKSKVQAWRTEKEEMINRPYEWTKTQMATGTASPSILKNLLTKLATNEPSSPGLAEEEDQIRWVTGTLFAAGAETTLSSIMTFLLAMILHPEIQARAQAELDSELGGSRLPELSDRDSLPYINMILKEVMRWRTVTPLGVAHACTQDDQYKGYRIPKGAIVAMSNDPKLYSNPEEFNPDRFMDPSVPDAPAFGSCPGMHFAEATIFITMCTILSTFNVGPIRDGQGCEILPSAEMSSNQLVSNPLPFDCSITPRSAKHAALLEEWAELE
ncbi:cytochrome P450 [Ceratobasidium sp. AG-I]|nr:cytochrome P450 [Ceratobasidium sp. AG-I]